MYIVYKVLQDMYQEQYTNKINDNEFINEKYTMKINWKNFFIVELQEL